jgi:hypothetical protein
MLVGACFPPLWGSTGMAPQGVAATATLLCPGIGVYLCTPPIIGASPTMVLCGVAMTRTPPSRHECLSVRTSHRVGESRNGCTRYGGSQHPPLHLGADDCKCIPHTIMSEFNNNSMLCGSDRHPHSIEAQMLASTRLPPSYVNLRMAPRGIV